VSARVSISWGLAARRMSRFFIIIFALFLALVLVGFLVIGAFPPHVHRQPVEHVLPNDKFH
jgi:hypothetical protein